MGAGSRYAQHCLLSTAWGAPAKAGRLTLGDVAALVIEAQNGGAGHGALVRVTDSGHIEIVWSTQ